MTTVAYKDGVLACDKQGTDCNVATGADYKAIIAGNTVYVITGTLTRGLRFIGWLTNGSEGKPPKLKDTLVIEFDKITGMCKLHESAHVALPVTDRIMAKGSGGDIALGAMHAGATPREAVKIATKLDIYTGIGVQVWTSKAHKDGTI